MIMTMGKLKYSKKNLSQQHFSSTINPIQIALGLKPGLYAYRLAT
jgi:hypothetical protein